MSYRYICTEFFQTRWHHEINSVLQISHIYYAVDNMCSNVSFLELHGENRTRCKNCGASKVKKSLNSNPKVGVVSDDSLLRYINWHSFIYLFIQVGEQKRNGKLIDCERDRVFKKLTKGERMEYIGQQRGTEHKLDGRNG